MTSPASRSTPRSVTLISGDGIGPEVVDATMRIIEAAGVKIEWECAFGPRPGTESHTSSAPVVMMRKS